MEIRLLETQNETWSYEKCLPDPTANWMLLDDGVYLGINKKGVVVPTKIMGQQLFIGERAKDIDTGDESICLIWHDRGQTCTATVLRQDISSGGSILKLANRGLIVHSGNAGKIVAYLDHLLDFNQDSIPVSYVASSCGYKKPEEHKVFMLGNEMITGDSNAPSVRFDAQADASGVLGAYRTGGNIDEWLAMARELGQYPVAAFGVAAAFLPPLLNDLKLPQNPIIDYSGVSSSGKTTVLRFIASVWGYPPEANGGLIRSWNSTPVFIEELARLANELPIFLDESHNANPKEVRNIIYQYGNGTGRGRGAKYGGVQKTARYRGVLFSAGEVKLTDVGNHDGIGARILGFWGSPFGQGKSELVRRITGTAYTHYGHAGRLFLHQYLLRQNECKELLKKIYEVAFTRLSTKANDGISERLASLCAAVEAAGRIANSILDLEWDIEAIVDQAFDTILSNRKVSSAQSSIEAFGEWYIQHKDMFYNDAISACKPSRQQAHGRMLSNADGTKGLAVMQDVLRGILQEHCYHFRSTVAHWADRGWLETDKGRNTKKVRFLGDLVNMIVLNEAGIVAARGGTDEDEDVLTRLGYVGSDFEQTDEDQPKS